MKEQYSTAMFAVKTFTSVLATRLEKSSSFQMKCCPNGPVTLQGSSNFYKTTNHLSESTKNKNKNSYRGEACFKHQPGSGKAPLPLFYFVEAQIMF